VPDCLLALFFQLVVAWRDWAEKGGFGRVLEDCGAKGAVGAFCSFCEKGNRSAPLKSELFPINNGV